MFSKSFLSFVTLSVLFVAEPVLGRSLILERDNRPVYLYPRRFGQENPAILSELSATCGGVCATLAGQAVSTLLAGAGECTQQDLADDIIDAAAQFDAATAQAMIDIAIQFRQAEKNTPPDFTTNPPTLRNSVFCQQAPRNSQLDGLVQAQDPANDPNVFFDPATKASVLLGSQANTTPFGGAAGNGGGNVATPPVDNAADAGNAAADAGADAGAGGGAAGGAADGADVNAGAVDVATEDNAGADENAGNAGGIGDFGSCSVPEIEFGAGFDGRTETSFRPVDPTSFTQGSAQNIDIVTRAMCDQLVNTCGADETAQATCAQAQADASAAPAGGAKADAFNAAFGKVTQFVDVAQIDDQGNVVGGGDAAAVGDAPVAAGGNADVGNGANGNAADASAGNAGNAAAANGANAGNGNGNGGNNDAAGAQDGANAGGNLQTFAGNLGGVAAPTVTEVNGQFQVEGNASFNSLRSALVRSCDVQNNQCANAANSGAGNNQNGLSVGACNAQQATCIAQADAAAGNA